MSNLQREFLQLFVTLLCFSPDIWHRRRPSPTKHIFNALDLFDSYLWPKELPGTYLVRDTDDMSMNFVTFNQDYSHLAVG